MTVDRYCVTVRQFARFVKATGYLYPEERLSEQIIQPCNCMRWVSLYDAQAYCEWIGGRLPTEKEWVEAIPKMAYSALYEWVLGEGGKAALRGGSWNFLSVSVRPGDILRKGDCARMVTLRLKDYLTAFEYIRYVNDTKRKGSIWLPGWRKWAEDAEVIHVAD